MPFTIEEKAWHYVQEIQWSIRIDPLVNKSEHGSVKFCLTRQNVINSQLCFNNCMVLDIVQEEVLEEGKKEIIRADFKKGNDKGRFWFLPITQIM